MLSSEVKSVFARCIKSLFEFLLYVWKLPQNLIGLGLRLFCRGEKIRKISGIAVYYLNSFPGGISLGETIMVGSLCEFTAKHERGHQIQSKILGPLYLFVIGIPSICWACLYGTKLFPPTYNGYYRFYTERWADKLGGVKRQYAYT